MENLNNFLKGLPGVTFTTPASPNYDSAKATYITNKQLLPLAVVRPQTAQDVATIISYSTANGIQFAIRSGGNNLFGYSSAHNVCNYIQ